MLQAADRTRIGIRDPQSSDEAAWRVLWAAYLVFYKVDVPEHVTAKTWARIMDPLERLSMRVAVVDDRMAGFAVHHHHDTSWDVRPACYLEDLFVDESIRGFGIGRALIDDLKAICVEKGFGRLYWHTEHDNHRARALYDSYADESGMVCYNIRL